MFKLTWVTILTLLFSINLIAATSSISNTAQLSCRCMPNTPCWPTEADWADLKKQLRGELIKPISEIESCKKNVKSAECAAALVHLRNPYLLESSAGGSQSQGWVSNDDNWFNGWQYSNSVYAVEAASAADIVAAVNFAIKYNLRLVIKGTGHDYLGRSNAPDSLLVWTHKMRAITFNNAFKPTGCSKSEKAVPAVTVEAGARWLEAYNEVTNKNGRIVLGGGCATVGVAGGFTQGGGFGSLSKKYGTGAAGMLEAEVILANGEKVIANKCQNPDLFWALRGGGGGTFGIVTHMTLKTHPLPPYIGLLQSTITAKNDVAHKKLLEEFIKFYKYNLNNEHWGEQAAFTPKNTINIFMIYQGSNQAEMEKVWLPMKKWVSQHPDLYTMTFSIFSVPPRKFWDEAFWQKANPAFITKNDTSNDQYWWTPNTNEIYNYWYTYQSWWLPISLFEDSNIKHLAEIFFKASRFDSVAMHINKGLSGASTLAVKTSQETAVNPVVTDTAALVIMAAGSNKIFPGVVGYEPNIDKIQSIIKKTYAAMKLFVDAAPNSGTYVNEADYFQKNWQYVFWGKNYERLLKIKNKYDPKGLFYCHHCVGSERWTADGMCLKKD